MKIDVETNYPTVELDTRFPGDIITLPDNPRAFYIVIEPDYGLDANNGIYCADLQSGDLYRFDGEREVIPVDFSATASF